MRPSDLPPLRDVIARHGLQATKALGQNFILDTNLLAKIVRQAGKLKIAVNTILEGRVHGEIRDRGPAEAFRADPDRLQRMYLGSTY